MPLGQAPPVGCRHFIGATIRSTDELADGGWQELGIGFGVIKVMGQAARAPKRKRRRR